MDVHKQIYTHSLQERRIHISQNQANKTAKMQQEVYEIVQKPSLTFHPCFESTPVYVQSVEKMWQSKSSTGFDN